MKCRKQLVLTGYRVQLVDLREPKPRVPREEIHVADRQWLDAVRLIGHNVEDTIKNQYERAGYKVFSIQPIKPKRVADIDLRQLWGQLAPHTTEEALTTPNSDMPGMSLTPMVAELVEAYKQKHGKWPSNVSIQVCQHIENVGAMFREQGRKEARRGEVARTAEKFVKLVRFAFSNSIDAETAQIIGGFWQSDYMDGYQEGGAV